MSESDRNPGDPNTRMWNLQNVNWRTKLDRVDLLWGIWVRSIFIHLPWTICFVLMFVWFGMSPQGISLIQYPVEYQWIRYAYIGAVVAIGDLTLLMTHGFRVDSLRAAAGKPSNSWVFRLLYWMAAFGFVGFLGNHSLGILLTSGTAMFVAWYLSKKFKKYDDVTVGSIIYAIWLLLLPPIFLAIGAYVVAHHIEWIAGLGAFAVVGIGLILLAANTPPLRKRSSIFAPRLAKGFPTGPTSRVNHIPPKCR